MDLIGTLASWASIVGLVFSVLAFVFSKRASKAAEEARDSVLLKSLSQDMSEADKAARDLLAFVGQNRRDVAQLKAGELLTDTAYFLRRWEAELPNKSKANLERAEVLLGTIHTRLMDNSATDPAEDEQLRQACQTVNSIFGGEHGAAVKGADLR
jgi:hypothetical protein